MTAKQKPVTKYVVKLSAEERERLNTLIHTGKRLARQVLKALSAFEPAQSNTLSQRNLR